MKVLGIIGQKGGDKSTVAVWRARRKIGMNPPCIVYRGTALLPGFE